MIFVDPFLPLLQLFFFLFVDICVILCDFFNRPVASFVSSLRKVLGRSSSFQRLMVGMWVVLSGFQHDDVRMFSEFRWKTEPFFAYTYLPETNISPEKLGPADIYLK